MRRQHGEVSRHYELIQRWHFVGTKRRASGILWSRTVSRAVSNSMLAALMVVTYLWGGCISCDQFFMFPQAKSDCCKKDVCERPSKGAPSKTSPISCEKMPLDHRTGANPVSAAAATLIQLPAAELPPFSGSVVLVAWFSNTSEFLKPITGS